VTIVTVHRLISLAKRFKGVGGRVAPGELLAFTQGDCAQF
jgi:hypothetical protein